MKELRLLPYSQLKVSAAKKEVQQGVEMIDAPRLWKNNYRGDGVVVAVIDTGCDIDHPDLQGRIIDGRNFTRDYNMNPNNFDDNHGHGTHVSGVIAANQDGAGVTGVAPLANLLVLKVLAADGTAQYNDLINAIHYAIDWRGPWGEQVRVVSMSLGGSYDELKLHDAIKRAVSNDILVVCAAGNEGDGKESTTEKSYPGHYHEVVSVGAVTLDKRIAEFTNTNEEIDLVAPGVNILSTVPGGKYKSLSGTSMATPHVAGGAAVLIHGFESKLNRKLTEPEIYKLLIKSTENLGYTRRAQGYGLLKLSKGLTTE
jgi:major intracellular serine protease